MKMLQSLGGRLNRLNDVRQIGDVIATELRSLIDYHNCRVSIVEGEDVTTLPPERRRVTHDNYARHLLHGDLQGRFSILAIVWDHGQSSPIHGHHCWCAVGIKQCAAPRR